MQIRPAEYDAQYSSAQREDTGAAMLQLERLFGVRSVRSAVAALPLGTALVERVARRVLYGACSCGALRLLHALRRSVVSTPCVG